MPRIIRVREQEPRTTRFPDLVYELAGELAMASDSGQPVIDERHYPRTGKVRATVLWDEWDDVPHEERVDVILRAYEKAEGKEARENVALAVGLTFPEAYESGMLPFQVIPVLRPGDPVTDVECRQAMILEGASRLFPGGKPELRFTTEDEAKAGIRRLAERLPRSEPVWLLTHEVGRIEPVGEAD